MENKKEIKDGNQSKKPKIVIAWILLFVLTSCLLFLNYLKFFGSPNPNIEERPIENSSSEAIQTALTQIVENFNSNVKIQEYSEKNIQLKAIQNQHSIFISYTTDTTVTYEFTYSNLLLSINIENNKENIEKFNKAYEILIQAIQERIGIEENIDLILDDIINKDKEYDGIEKEISEDIIEYKINITKKLKLSTNEIN